MFFKKKKKKLVVIQKQKCKCGALALAKHPCPYATDVHNDHETMCRCCDDCTAYCAKDI